MRAAAGAHDILIGAPQEIRGAGNKRGYYGRTYGVTHKYKRVTYQKDGSMEPHANNGVIQLAVGHMSTQIVSHELIHAVAWTFKIKYGPSMGRAYSNSWREEKLAQIYGDTFSQLTRILHKKGFWS